MRRVERAGWRWALLLVALGLALASVGCGRKGPPVVPREPQAVRPQLSYLAQGEALALSWRYALEAAAPEAFRVERAEPEEGCPDCPPRFRVLGTVPARSGLADYAFEDTGLTPGATYIYRVVPLFPRGVEGPASEPVSLAWRATPPPTGLAAAPEPAGVRLFWEPEVGMRGYAVFRAEPPGVRFTKIAQVEVPPYLDTMAQPGKTYFYSVAAVGRSGEGPPSEAVQATMPR